MQTWDGHRGEDEHEDALAGAHADAHAGRPASSRAEGMPHRLAAAVGDYGERMAERYLRDHGLEILARNWRCPHGEIDIVARDGGCLVVCEVKTRRGGLFGGPAQAVTFRKLARLRRLAAAWLAEREAAGAPGFTDVRIDVVGVVRPRRGPCVIEHLVGVA